MGLSTSQITPSEEGELCKSSQQLQLCLQTRPPIASISASFSELMQNLPWNQGQRAVPRHSSAGAQIEPKTNTYFEERFCQRGNSRCGDLAGVGVRSKKIAGVKSINVYALGLYVDVPAAKAALRSYRGKSPEALARDQSFYDALVKADGVDKTLHMSIAFGRISSQQFWEAMRAQLAGPMAQAGADAELQQFAKTFEGLKLRKGMPLSFCISKDSLTSKIDGKLAGTIRSRALCEAVLGVYLGRDPVSPDAKQNIGSGLATMLAE